mmetsp:Transcript_70636/g.124622  ORF Transcript_70636/g.124622 Transcript_70636/m.124622 type:complete len:228 (+) Transcript_70636:1530-2213(+)
MAGRSCVLAVQAFSASLQALTASKTSSAASTSSGLFLKTVKSDGSSSLGAAQTHPSQGFSAASWRSSTKRRKAGSSSQMTLCVHPSGSCMLKSISGSIPCQLEVSTEPRLASSGFNADGNSAMCLPAFAPSSSHSMSLTDCSVLALGSFNTRPSFEAGRSRSRAVTQAGSRSASLGSTRSKLSGYTAWAASGQVLSCRFSSTSLKLQKSKSKGFVATCLSQRTSSTS